MSQNAPREVAALPRESLKALHQLQPASSLGCGDARRRPATRKGSPPRRRGAPVTVLSSPRPRELVPMIQLSPSVVRELLANLRQPGRRQWRFQEGTVLCSRR